ncbi:MAG: glycosyltransferase family 2 protein [Varibaculum sp.]|nr:glycosyltransferase family 2 protein [Varibaculum sp.]
MSGTDQQPRGQAAPGIAVVIPAMNEEERIAGTVRACKGIPGVDLIVVVDDGSTDRTQKVARDAGAATVRHTVNRGKASAMETGANVVAMRDAEGAPRRLLLFLDADLGESAIETAVLTEPVLQGRADCSIAALPKQEGAGGHGFVLNLSRRAIARATGWRPTAPLSGQRCITRDAFEAAKPLAAGWGVETAMTVAVLVAGYATIEVPCDLRHRVSKNDWAGQWHRFKQYLGVLRAVIGLGLQRQRLSRTHFAAAAAAQRPYEPYRART